ncbi:MAG TPA: Hint domain-containing protein [Polyangia bacterium]|nr:Hint domain-containing protein [Polyangia bacterium]
MRGLGVVLLLAGLSSTANAWQQTAQDRQDLQYVRDLHLKSKHRSHSRTLDLSDPIQYRHFMSQIAAAGYTAARYPQLFKSIEETHQTHLAARKAGKTMVSDPPSCPQDQVCPVNTFTNFGAPVTNPMAFGVEVLTSIPGTPYIALNSIGLYDQNGTVFAGPQPMEQLNTGYDVDNALPGTAPAGTTMVQAQGVWYYQPQTGGGVPGSFYAAEGPGQDPTITNQQPYNVTGNPQIVICVTRTTPNCDYVYAASGGQFIVTFPLQGNVTYPNPIAVDGTGKPLNGIYSVTISSPTSGQGGGCTPLPINQTFANYLTVNNNVVSWNVNPATFGVASPCFPSNTTVIYDLMMTVYDTNNTPWIITVTSEQGAPQSDTLRILPTVVQYGCMAEGTLVTMADETRLPIEKVRIGDQVRSNADRMPLTVFNYTKGYEKPPMYALTTENKRTLLLTHSHPVMTNRGFVTAENLKVGDVLHTDGGHAKLVKIERKQYDGNVWNLDVGTPRDRVRVTDTNTTFYANGVLVGDRQIQGRMERADRERPENVLKGLDKKWLVDFKSAEEDRLARERGR